MNLQSNNVASDSGHWYDLQGRPCYTIVGKNGVERGTTLRDARTMNLVPSVTTITKAAAAPGLVNWMLDQAILSALTLTRQPDETDEAFLSRVKRDSKEQARKAAERGTEIHGAIEKHFKGIPPDGDMFPIVKAVSLNLKTWFGDLAWDAERSFAHPLGYGGKCDLHAKAERIVVDFKGKEFTDPTDCKLYDEHLMQGAAYLEGFGLREGGRFAICFVSRNQPGLVCIIEAKPEEISRGWRMFRKLLEFWQEQSRYAPIAKEAA
jgi:hypothetical protein